MDEQFLHHIWKYQKFDQNQPLLTNGESLSVFYPGNHNQDSGPDFEEARIKIGNLEWAGQIEIHLQSSDWLNHKHQDDPAYNSVILHVVWSHDKEILIEGNPIPTFEMNRIVNPDLLERYKNHIKGHNEILCRNKLDTTASITKSSMLDKVLIERLEVKATRILDTLKSNKNNWEETTYQALSMNFGFSTNKEAFRRLTELLPFTKLKKALNNLRQTEALIFGQSGFLENEVDAYQKELKAEFEFLRKKYQLPEAMLNVHWKFGKLRPANFPSVRLAQLASLLSAHPQIFSILIETKDIKKLKEHLLQPLSEYWQTHYDFGKPRKKPSPLMGQNSFENLLINTVAPLLAAYSKYTANQECMDRAIKLLESLKPESNRIVKKWEDPGLTPKTAFDSQALIQLFNNYCLKRKCLQCNIGVEILNK